MARTDNGVGYDRIIEKIFFDHYEEGTTEFEFIRREIIQARDDVATDLVDLNPGDVPYAYRYRREFPPRILATQRDGLEWIIEGAGRARYRFKLVRIQRILPRTDLITIAIPDATPELIRAYALDDEQALLAIVRYNRLIDTFLGLTTYSLQNHLRTHVKGIGQIEIDELYIGLDKQGCHYVIPVQAKGGNDQIGVVQTTQDIRFAEQKFAGMRCRPVSAQFMQGGVVALFELALEDGHVKVVEERHYKLVPAKDLDRQATIAYRFS
ncbi:endonuclease [Sinorhizobium meliloti]|uniref:endonuclease n=1 Tax=Rhizobium meliloti TaxID=382 RepID=UPI000FDBD277|nr:endonuclease [Sinorhizobium meliloti]MDW9896305.1 endonuclease [Sinorhizobium meliloti]RVQ54224.1 endonuclease [Sinorhizobium meliloti]